MANESGIHAEVRHYYTFIARSTKKERNSNYNTNNNYAIKKYTIIVINKNVKGHNYRHPVSHDYAYCWCYYWLWSIVSF